MQKLIFILEDNDDLRELYTYILEDENYKLETFATVTSFMEQSNKVPDLYLLDVMLPDGDGLVLCKELKENPRTADVPVIIVSAHKHIQDVKEKCPSAEFLSKPFDISDLVKCIQNNI
jgi:DNA-binding response OmpR family regulator